MISTRFRQRASSASWQTNSRHPRGTSAEKALQFLLLNLISRLKFHRAAIVQYISFLRYSEAIRSYAANERNLQMLECQKQKKKRKSELDSTLESVE